MCIAFIPLAFEAAGLFLYPFHSVVRQKLCRKKH